MRLINIKVKNRYRFSIENCKDQGHTLRGARNLSDNSDSANASPVRATVSAVTPILSRSSCRPE